MNLLFTICGRAGSKGVANKNIRDFLGFPLPFYTLSSIDLFCKNHKERLDRIHIALNTDSGELLKIAESANIPFYYIQRTSELGSDTASKLDVIRDTFVKCQALENVQYDIVIDLDLTSPLRTQKNIEDALALLISDSNCDIVYSVTNARRNPYFNMVKKGDNNYYEYIVKSNFTTRQMAPQIFDMNASIYAYRDSYLRDDQKKFADAKALITTMIDTAVLDIDSEEDYELMQIIAEYFYGKYDELDEVRQNIQSIIE